MNEVDTVVIGGGITGCAIAYHLACSGVRVMLFERGELNREASGSNAGTIHLQVRRHEDRLPGRLGLIAQSARAWRDIERELEADIELRLHGGLMVAETGDEVALLNEKLPLDNSLGLDSELLAGADVHRLEPRLSPRIEAAVYCPYEGSSNPLLVTQAYARRARDHGAEIRTHASVRALDRRPDGGFLVRTASEAVVAARIVSAAGAWTAAIARMLDLELSVWGCPLSVTVTEPLRPLVAHVIQHIGRKLTMKQTVRGAVLIGGGWFGLDGDGNAKEAALDSIAGNAWEALNVLPPLASARVLRTWTGIVAVTGDGLPIIGEHPDAPGFLIVVVPVGSAGYTVAPVVARLAAGTLTSSGPLALLDDYVPDRPSV